MKKTKRVVEDYKGSSVISLITNYKRRGMFEARLVEHKNEKKNYVYLKIGEEDFYIDLEENEIVAGLFSEKEMANIIEDLIIENLRLETNLRIASKKLTQEEQRVLELAAHGQHRKDISSKLDIPEEAIEVCQRNICVKMGQNSIHELIKLLREKKLQ